MAEEKKQEMLDPIAYREDFPKEYLTDYDPMADLTPEYLENMDYGKAIGGGNQSFSQYGDDSSPEYQQKAKGGLNDKYTGEGVKNDQLNYDANLTTKDLNPNFVYGLASKVYGTDHPGYITQRNDQIASALYNEGKTSKDDIAYFLGQQKGWMNSSEADRANTIEAVYKRLGAIAEQNPKEEEKPDLSKADNLVQDTSGKIYGKTTADEGEPSKGIDTLADANSVFTSMQESRAAKLKSFISMNPSDIAELMNSGTAAFDEQTVRDAQELYPEFMAQVNAEKKKKLGQQNVNAIMNGGEMVTDTNGQSNANNSIAEFGASNATGTKSSTEITKDVHNAMAQSQTASEASETMAEIEEYMAVLKNRMKNLRKEANAAFKGDVPDYLVNAYINNKAQEIQNQMSILEDRYNAAYNRYNTELSNKQWEMEYKLKQDKLQIQRDELALKEYQIKNGITTTENTGTSTTNPGDKFQVTTLSDKEVANAVDSLYSMFDNGQIGNAQCGVGIQRYYLPMLGISISGISSLEGKKSLINENSGYTPKKGDLIIINSGAKLEDGTPAGHIGIVLEVHSDGTVEYMDWNGKSDEKPAINGISINSKSILGYRNINKGQGQNSGGWTDYDYEQFEKFRDATTESLRKSIANGYGMDVDEFNSVARNALSSRGEDNSSDIELGYDEELGYNPYDKDIYEQIISDKMTLEDGAKKTGSTEKEIRRRVLNYQEARANGVDAYDDGSRNVDEKYGFNLDKKMIYQTIANAGGKIPGTQKDTILKELGLNPRDPNAWDKALNETSKWQEWQKQELDSQAKEALAAVEYIIMQDATKAQRDLAMDNTRILRGTIGLFGSLDRMLSGEAASWKASYDYIRDKLTLDYLVDLKNRGATFGALSNQELEAIGNAASLINYDTDTYMFHQRVNDLYNTLRKSLGYNELTEKELSEMWNAEDGSESLDNYIMYDTIHKSGLFGGSDYGTKDIYPTRNSGINIYNRWGDSDGGNGGEILNDVLNG